jgi:hypothetical protein
MRRLVLFLPLFLAACGTSPSDPRRPILLDESTRFCRTGACGQTPTVIAVIREPAPPARPSAPPRPAGVREISFSLAAMVSGFTFAGWVRYDGRLDRPGERYLAFLDPKLNKVCEGLYHWDGGRENYVDVACFESRAEVTGYIRSAGRQTRGRFAGKAVGLGILVFEGGRMAVIYGATVEEVSAPDFSFRKLWLKYGGDSGEFPARIPERRDIVPRLKESAGVAPDGERM